jgi:hypothetical protein
MRTICTWKICIAKVHESTAFEPTVELWMCGMCMCMWYLGSGDSFLDSSSHHRLLQLKTHHKVKWWSNSIMTVFGRYQVWTRYKADLYTYFVYLLARLGVKYVYGNEWQLFMAKLLDLIGRLLDYWQDLILLQEVP